MFAVVLAPHGSIGIRVTTGMIRNCTAFAPASVQTDVAGKFVASEGFSGINGCSDAELMNPWPNICLDSIGVVAGVSRRGGTR